MRLKPVQYQMIRMKDISLFFIAFVVGIIFDVKRGTQYREVWSTSLPTHTFPRQAFVAHQQAV
jgi:hypothetical protein